MRSLLVLLLLLMGHTLQAQYNDSTHYYFRYASTGSINSTDEGHAYLLNNALKVGVKKTNFTMNGSASYIYGQQNRSITNNDFASAIDFNYKSSLPGLYYWGLASYEKSVSLKINDRLQSGVGVAYGLLDTKTSMLNISDGILYEKSDLFLNDTIRDVYHTFRNSFRLQYRFSIHDIVIIDGSNFYQNSLQHGDDYIIKSVNNLSVKLRKWLLITASMAYNRSSRTGKENLLFNYGFTIEKYF
ncbi:DUF481 domain-containing protein [Chitinophaga costaii]|nr:DUF481 domain-containing protein [Chitinophaga costaii]